MEYDDDGDGGLGGEGGTPPPPSGAYGGAEGEDGGAGAGELTAVDLLRRAWLNEKAAPEVLGFKRELVERLQEEVHGREDFLENNDFGPEHELLRTMHLMDLNRVRYVLRAYLRTRLLKIEGNALQIVSSGLMDMLSAKEKAHVEEYTNTIGEFFDSSVLANIRKLTHGLNNYDSMLSEQMPQEDREEKDMIPGPDLDEHVFAQALETIEKRVVDGEELEMGKGEVYVTRYRTVRDLLHEDRVCLI